MKIKFHLDLKIVPKIQAQTIFTKEMNIRENLEI